MRIAQEVIGLHVRTMPLIVTLIVTSPRQGNIGVDMAMNATALNIKESARDHQIAPQDMTNLATVAVAIGTDTPLPVLRLDRPLARRHRSHRAPENL